MSDYPEPRNRRTSPFYVMATILGTILAMSVIRFILGIGIIGGLVEFLVSFSEGLDTHTDY